jgi:hypothetical protein
MSGDSGLWWLRRVSVRRYVSLFAGLSDTTVTVSSTSGQWSVRWKLAGDFVWYSDPLPKFARAPSSIHTPASRYEHPSGALALGRACRLIHPPFTNYHRRSVRVRSVEGTTHDPRPGRTMDLDFWTLFGARPSFINPIIPI